MRIAALLLTLLLVLAGCTWSDTEPGFFREPGEASEPPPPAPEPTDPRLPVAGETTWTSAEGLRVTTRIAVHAVRRTAELTVLDWSITPLRAPDLRIGDPVPPGFDLGLDRSQPGGINLVLVDPRGHRVYRPLTHEDAAQGHPCLCTPLWAVQADIRIGETRLLQVAYPPLPRDVRAVDVLAATLPPFSHVPVSAAGTVPTVTAPTDLARPEEPPEPLTVPQQFRTGEIGGQRRTASLRVDRVLAGDDATTVTWTLRSMSDQRTFLVVPLGPPVVAPVPADAPVISLNAASGPTISAAGGAPLTARWMTGDYRGRPFLECACTNLDFWAIGLRDAGGAAQLVTTYPALPRGTDRVDVTLPGLGTLPQLRVTPATDGATRVGPAAPAAVDTWTVDRRRPLPGWSTRAWPTPVPDPAQLADYAQRVDRLTDLGR